MANLSPDTRRRILAAASTLFAQRAFDKVKMDDVADAAMIGKVTIYRYFPTKDDLYLRLLEDVGQEYMARLREADASAKGCRARLVALVRAALDYFYVNPRLIELLDRAGIDHGRQADFPWLDVQRQFFGMLEGLFAKGAHKEEFGVDDVELAVRALLGAMRFHFLYPCAEIGREEIPERIVEMLVRPVATASAARAA